MIVPDKRFMTFAAAALLPALTSACQTQTPGLRVETVMSTEAPFSRYRSFSFGLADNPPTGFQVSSGSLDVENRLRPLVEGALARKGYAEDRAEADFVVRLGAGTAEVSDTDMQRCTVDDYDCVGQSMHGLAVAIDMYDTATGAHVWHGATNLALARSRFDDELLNNIVATAFVELPRRD